MSKKQIYLVPFLYVIIIILANLCGVTIPHFFNPVYSAFYNIEQWQKIFYENPFSVVVKVIVYVLPVIFCISYAIIAIKKRNRYYANLPIALSFLGISGWIMYIIYQVCFFFVVSNMGYKINYEPIILSSVMNILQADLSFSFSYFVISAIHNRFILPKMYPDGKISKEKGIWRPSITFLFLIDYISVTLFPILLLLFFYNPNSVGKYSSILVLVSIMIIGLVINLGLSFTFKKPIKQIKKHIEKIKEGNYSSHMNFVSNNDFAEFSETMNEMTDSIEQKTQKIIEIQNSIITGMATMVESRDNSTGGHIKRTSDCVRVFSEYLKQQPAFSDIDEQFFANLIKAAPMHDLGKIAVPDAVLQKPGKFTDEEYEKMKIHSREGARIVSEVLSATEGEEFKKIAINVAHYHHEKWNGTGYPEKISGEQIPLEARIMALADVFDALVSKRCYKENFSYDRAFGIIQDSLGTHFDPELGAEFIKCRQELEKLYDSYWA